MKSYKLEYNITIICSTITSAVFLFYYMPIVMMRENYESLPFLEPLSSTADWPSIFVINRFVFGWKALSTLCRVYYHSFEIIL